MRRPTAGVGAALLLLALGVSRPIRADVPVTPAALSTATGQELSTAGWRVAPGDDPRWASARWDDSRWRRVGSTRPGLDAGGPDWAGIGWYRLRLDVAPEVAGPLVLQLSHWGASEVFLDGRRVGGFGVVASSADRERTSNPRGRGLTLPIRSPGAHVIAVRYSAQSQAGTSRVARWYATVTPPGLTVRLLTPARYAELRERDHVRNVSLLTGLSVAFGAFALLHLLYAALERHDHVNLAFGGYAIGLAGLFFLQLHRELVEHTVRAAGLLQLAVLVLLAMVGLSLVAFVTASRGRRVPVVAWLLAGAHAALALVAVTQPATASISPLSGLLQLGLVGVAMTLALRARNDAMQGRWPLIVSALVGSIPLVLTAFQTLGVPVAPAPRLLIVQAGLAMVLILASIGQARRFAATNRDLQAQLLRVRDLSARERERERAEVEAHARRDRERSEAERQARELEEARAFQLSLLPARLPDLAGWEAVASMRTATEVGGDYFDVRRQADGTATLVIGDATGHGLRAGTLVATTKGLFQAVGDHRDLGEALQTMGQALRDLHLRGLFMALTIVRLFPDGRLALASAGMPPAILLSRQDTTISLGTPAPPLGAPVRYTYAVETHVLRPGDRLVLMTDGVPERLGPDDELFGYARVPSLLLAHSHHRGAAYVHAMEAEVDTWAGRAADDDATWLVITKS